MKVIKVLKKAINWVILGAIAIAQFVPWIMLGAAVAENDQLEQKVNK